MKTQTLSAVGIDIAKDKFDAVHLPSNEHAIFENNKEGIKRFIHWARKRKPTTIVCEVTGGEQNEFVRRLIKANLQSCPHQTLHRKPGNQNKDR